MNTKKCAKSKNKYPIIIVDGGNIQEVYGCLEYILIDYDNIKEEEEDELENRISFYKKCIKELGHCEESQVLEEVIKEIEEIKNAPNR